MFCENQCHCRETKKVVKGHFRDKQALCEIPEMLLMDKGRDGRASKGQRKSFIIFYFKFTVNS